MLELLNRMPSRRRRYKKRWKGGIESTFLVEGKVTCAMRDTTDPQRPARNVLGGPLRICSAAPMTGFFRDGCCNTGPGDIGSHTVCVVVTAEFLAFSAKAGNDLARPVPEYGFPGLKPGDRWCLCAPRWQEALQAGRAPKVLLAATHEGALEYTTLADLKRFAVDLM